ncbi:hypothetical protein CIB95_12575 [Lottiidibacillus patelloidae]|uniref:CRISPR type III-associated protein domain-containing protein n=1 Tax=Lottiidibacillus patelloidae TaxID=2670334 RepID=A0A263BRP9_9BACI|nr:RAMP superfamily CRISPR-associated protein [Lottiidibacillus patelloidae]OZM56252.1 hypothetical protein CIB95_12575 [Lottiidibacillus patelloidae]
MDKTYYLITLETASPLVLSNRPSSGDSSVFHSLEYIPGASIRGAFIQLMKQLDKYQDEVAVTKEVKDLFVEEGYRFGNFHPANSSLLPLTAVSCKQFPGFVSEDFEKNHGVRDSLLDNYLNTKEYNSASFECNHETEGGKVCQSPLLPYDRPITALEDYQLEGFLYQDARLVNKLQTGHIAIDPITQTNKKGHIFFENTIDIEEIFEGIIEVPREHKAVFENVMNINATLRVGSKRTSGFGMLNVTNCQEVNERIPTEGNPSLNKSLEERWKDFQSLCREKNVIKQDEFAFSITCMSDAILKDNWFRYRTDLTKDLLENYTNLTIPDFTLEYSQVSTKQISGWNQMWKTALDDEVGIKVGSSYLFKSKEGSDEEWIDLLGKIENMPIGERTYDGFGTVFVCHPFHLQMEEV